MNTENDIIFDDILEDDVSVVDSEAGSVIENQDGTKTVKLKYPFEATLLRNGVQRKEHITSFTFRRMKGEDLEAAEKAKTEFNKAKIIFARLSGAPIGLYGKIDTADMNVINETILSFLD